MSIATLAGLASTVIFAASMLPMLLRAARTKDVASYSRSHLVLSTVGNLVHTVYVVHLPAGPIWALHTFYLLSTAQMLRWHVAHRSAGRAGADRQVSPSRLVTTARSGGVGGWRE